MEKTTMYCDICKVEMPIRKKQQIQVIFTTEQTEGRRCKMYLDYHNFDICSKCTNHILEGNYLYGQGAQGYNKYYFKN